MASIDPLEAWVNLLRETPEITALVAQNRIVYEIDQVLTGAEQTWILPSILSTQHVPGFYDLIMSFHIFAPYGHVSRAVQQVFVDDLCDPLTRFKRHRVMSGNQEGAVISTGSIVGFYRGRLPIQQVELPYRSISLESKVSVEAMAWI